MMARQPWQLSLRSLLFLVTLAACCLGLYLGVWPAYPLVPAFVTLIVAAAFGFAWKWTRGRNGVLGAVMGGVVGANLAVTFHFICGYTMHAGFEDEGLGLVGGVLLFSPFATLFGIIVGGLVGANAYLASSIVSYWLAQDKPK